MKAITVEPKKAESARYEDFPGPGNILARADRNWLRRLITRCEMPQNFNQALERKPDDIKVVIQFSEV